jgi:hypothetical protein
MKLRIQGNNLRLRLSEAEVQAFAQTGRVDEAIALGPGEDKTMHYVLARRDAVAGLTVDFVGNSIIVYVPESVAAAWTGNSDTDLCGVVDNGSAPGLQVRVEKDQDCKH